MKELLKKYKILIIGLIIAIILFTIIFVAIKSNSPDAIVKKYCDIMVKGNYKDMLDIAYLPNSEFITKEKLEEAKNSYFEKMQHNNNVVSCTYSKTNENDEKIYYKLNINGTNSKNIEMDKKTKKILIDDLYETKKIETYTECLVTIDGKEVKNSIKENNKEIYEVTLLSNVNYEIKVKPKKGVDDETLNEQIKKESEDGSKIALINRNTDLENGIETLTFSREYDDGILALKGSFDLVYEFTNINSWVYTKKDNENYQKTWNISGTWENVTTTGSKRLELKEENGIVTGTYKNVSTIGVGSEHTFNYTSGTFSDGKIEMSGSYTYDWAYSTKTADTKMIGTINSKEKTITISVSPSFDSGMSFAGTAVLTKKTE